MSWLTKGWQNVIIAKDQDTSFETTQNSETSIMQRRQKRPKRTSDESLFVATVGLKADTQQEDWIIDLGASRHMAFQISKGCTLLLQEV